MSAVRYVIPNLDLPVREMLGQVTPLAVEVPATHPEKGKKVSDLVLGYFSHPLCVIHKREEYVESGAFYLYSEVMRTSLARLTYSWYRLCNDAFGSPEEGATYFGSPVEPIEDYVLGGSYGGVPRISNLCITDLSTNEKWINSGFGTYVLQSAVEWSKEKGCEGRISIQVGGCNRQWWYYIKGFVSGERGEVPWTQEDGTQGTIPRALRTNQLIEEALATAKTKKKEPSIAHLGSFPMELSPKGIGTWMTKINASPLLRNPEALLPAHKQILR